MNELSCDDSSTVLLTIRLLLTKNKLSQMNKEKEYFEDWNYIESYCGKNTNENTNSEIDSGFDTYTTDLLSKIIISMVPDLVLDLDCEDILFKMQKNNFQVINSIFQPIGSGVYPIGALLNHSCAPNCIFTYEYDEKSSTFIQKIRAIKDIKKGEEITHSYIEPALPTIDRQKRLYRQYEFHCTCNHCTEPNWEDKNISKTDLILAGTFDRILSPSDHIELEKSQEVFDQVTLSDNNIDQIKKLEKCLEIREKILHPYALCIFIVRSRLVDCYFAEQNTKKAIYHATKNLHFYEQSGVYGKKTGENNLVIHPLIGLQYNLLADLMLQLLSERKEKGKKVEIQNFQTIRQFYETARNILQVIYGTQHELISNITEQLNS